MIKNLLFIVTIFTVFSCGQKQKPTLPNIVMILTDDQGWGDLHFNGNSNVETPNIDKLAQTGVVFDRFYVCPVCSPTRAEVLTGRYHVRSGVWSTEAGGERMDSTETTIAELFKAAGYKTAAYGKWHNGMQPPYHPNARGFDDFYGFCSGHWGNYYDAMLENNGEIVQGKGFIIDDLTSHGIEFIKQNRNNPFFLYLPFNTPHSPMQVPDKWWDKYKNRNLTMFSENPEKEDTAFTRAALAMCENIDWNVGRLTASLEELGLLENTIIIYFSDNGPNGFRWNGGMKGKKGSTDEGGVRSPMIMKWKGIFNEGGKIEEIAAAIDLLPTLADLAGISTSETKPLDGISLKPLLTGKNSTWPDRTIFSYWNGNTSLRNHKFRLDAKNQLFDMENDPGQKENVAKKFQEVYSALVDEKNDWEANVASQLIRTPAPFTLGHPDFGFTQLPARDALPHGNIQRSNRWSNSSYFLNWISTTDSITWDVEVLETGLLEVELFYTCPEEDLGSEVQLAFKENILKFTITEEFDPPLLTKQDIYPRMEGYVKDFKKVIMGKIQLEKGTAQLTFKATAIPGKQVMDFRLFNFKRINS